MRLGIGWQALGCVGGGVDHVGVAVGERVGGRRGGGRGWRGGGVWRWLVRPL